MNGAPPALITPEGGHICARCGTPIVTLATAVRTIWADALDGPMPTDLIERITAQVADIMAARIDAGEFSIGERFASLAALRREFAISDATARRAVRELADRGLIHTVRGRASFTGPADAGHPRPRYQRIAAELAAQIFSGEIPISHVIPPRKELMARYGVSGGTVDHAVRRLVSLGWVVSVPYRRPIAAPPSRWPVRPRATHSSSIGRRFMRP
jgi:DNA-binding FadR family transcriptional regulator